MAGTRFEYVRHFEQDDRLLDNCWIVIRIDGRAFGKFTQLHRYNKPNDLGGVRLMTHATCQVMKNLTEVVLGYAHSDEVSLLLHRRCKLFKRRASKLLSTAVSCFSAAFVFFWKSCFPDRELLEPPVFDARVVLYPTDQNLRDYFAWRQADCHINNLYNTCFWNLVKQGGLSHAEAEARLRGTVSAEKNEMLFSEFGINYNDEPEVNRKGSVLFYSFEESAEDEKKTKTRRRNEIVIAHVDIIGSSFWTENKILD